MTSEQCAYCGPGPCPHPDIFVPATGQHGCTGPHARRNVEPPSSLADDSPGAVLGLRSTEPTP
jgi:hypothetical protein